MHGRFRIFAIMLLCLVCPASLSAQNDATKRIIDVMGKPYPASKKPAGPPVLLVAPHELDLGIIGPGTGETSKYVLKNTGGGKLTWVLTIPEEWSCQEEDEELTGILRLSAGQFKIRLKYDLGSKGRNTHRTLQLILETGRQMVTCRKDMPPGMYREALILTSNGGTQTVFFTYRIPKADSEALMDLWPPRMDFGSLAVGEQATRRVRILNKGREILKWTVDAQPPPTTGLQPAPQGRYVSFVSEEVKEKGVYVPPVALRDVLQLSGVWLEENGYPVGSGVTGVIRFRFSGTGIALLIWKNPEGRSLVGYVDDKPVNSIDCHAEQREAAEVMVVEDLADGSHLLTLVNKDGYPTIEGVRVYGKELVKGSPGWLTVFPGSGTTMRETDYVNVMINAQHLSAGWHGGQVLFNSNGGKIGLEISFEVLSSQVQRLLDVYRYTRGTDYFLTTNPEAESASLQAGHYVKQGISFRLFSSGTPGTTNFHRWYNPQKGDRFYAYDSNGAGKSLKGYVYEGIIGNIATSRLTGTRELYRWYHPGRGVHFYSTDPKGEGFAEKGYHFDGIAGYVR